ncbi:MAG: hypothetical protein R6U96_13080 [Promethearchaeia archaeon]
MEKSFMKSQKKRRNFVLSVVLATGVTIFLLFIPVWQLILIPGILAGLINKEIKRSVYSAIISVSVVWSIFMVINFYTKNAYKLLDQFAGFIFGGLGFGYVIFIIILLMGIIFGALGAIIGGYLIQFYEVHRTGKSETRND